MRPRTLLALAIVAPCSLAAQTSVSRTSLDPVMLEFETFADIFGSRLVAAFDSIPAARYDYRPTPVQQTIGYIGQHLEAANYGLCERLAPQRHAATAKDSLADSVKARWPKDTLVARLEASLRYCDTVIESLGPLQTAQRAAALLAFETDLAEHYSQLSNYMRLLGITPPSALTPMARTTVVLPAGTFPQYVGTYEIASGWDLVVTASGDRLLIRSSLGGNPVRLWPESANEFFVKEVDARITFTRNASSAITGLVLHQWGRDRPAKKIR